MLKLTLRRDAIGPVSRGHPWVYTSGLTQAPPPPGQPVLLLDGRGRPVGFGLSDAGDIAVRVLGRHGGRIGPLLEQRIAAAARARAQLLPPDTTAWRMVNGAGDGLPGLVVDRYGPVAVVRLYGQCWVPWQEEIAAALVALPGVVSVLRRLGVRRVDGQSGAQTLAGPKPAQTLVVQECGLRFLVRPYVGQKTGLFLDQREHRRFIGGSSSGLAVCNLFAYTGGFSVYAAAGGARRVVTVDIAAEAIADAQENFRLNSLDPSEHEFVVTDVFQWSPASQPELMICDPPSLSRARGSDAAAGKAYRELATRCGQAMAVGGLLATASCTARLSQQRWEQEIRDGLRKAGRWSWLWRAAEPPDHPIAAGHSEGRYLKFALLRRWR